MSGKSYTMREMKTIVEYLVEHGAYSETKGRKMWMDFAATRLTNRTWQSLKECFLKRILTDIHNPYFRLDVEQIHSFKRGVDLTNKQKEKLEFQPVDEEPSKNENGDIGQPSTSKINNEANATGEDTTSSKIVHNRASTETLILDNCYETAEDIQKELDKSTDEEHENQKEKPKSTAKSVRDFIVYSEPLTPMLQEVLDDFATDESDPPMEIDESYVNPQRRSNSPENAAQSQSILHPESSPKADETASDIKEDSKKDKRECDEVIRTENKNEPEKKPDDSTLSQLEDVMVLVDKALAKDLDHELNSQNTENQNKTQSSNEASSVISDTLLPNNQEAVAFDNQLSSSTPNCNPNQVAGKRKHSSSVEMIESSKKRHVETDQAVSNVADMGEIQESKPQKAESPAKCNENENDINQIESLKKKRNLTLNTTNSKNAVTRKLSVEQRRLSHEKQVDSEQVVSDSNNGNHQSISQSVNPCLKSVSLYAEQFSSTKYSDSDLDDKMAHKVHKVKENGEEKEKVNSKPEEDVILLKSRSNSESNGDPVEKNKPPGPSSKNLQKDKILASVFGFANGNSKRINNRKRTTSHRTQNYGSSESSEWTSASDSEFISPPRGRRHRYARKYLKPKSARVRCLEDGGGLFVMLGKKIYPFVRDGKIIKNYVSYLPDSDPEDEDYWKSKYVEERKRNAELKKVIEQSKQNGDKSKNNSISVSSPSPQPKNQRPPSTKRDSNNGQALVTRRDSESAEKTVPEKTVKIKFTKFDQEVQLEGHWQHLNPVLAQVVSMFHNEPPVKPEPEPVKCIDISSGNTTPSAPAMDAGVHEKINKIESDIFKEIEEKDEEEKDLSNGKEDVPKENGIDATPENVVVEPNVTLRKRRGRAKKESTPIVPSPVISEEPIDPASDQNVAETLQKQEVTDQTPSLTSGRRTKTPRKLLEVPEVPTAAKRNTRRSNPVKTTQEIEDEEVLYKFPSPLPGKRRRKSTIQSKNAKETLDHSNHKVNSPESISHHSATSSQGYQDSDTSPYHISIRRKRRSISTLSIKRRTQRKYRSRSYPITKHVSEINSSFNISLKTTREQSSVNSEVYRSESYQFLVPRTRKIMEELQKIDETAINELANENDGKHDNEGEKGTEDFLEHDGQKSKNDAGSSSILSLPLSPELSMVENISIRKNALAAIGDYPSIEQNPNSSELDAFDKYLMSGVDVTMPLMGQECGLRESYRKHLMSAFSNLTRDVPNSAGRNLRTLESSSFKVSSVSESILDKICNTNIEVTADSLDKRLEQLLLESVQKPKLKKPEKMDVDTEVKKKGSRKRCSTPNKKQAIRKTAKASNEGPLIEEECKAKCARTGRRSCPPSINIVYYENNAPDNVEINIHDQSVDVTTMTKRKNTKKDVIKVKILKPKDKPQYRRRLSPKEKVQTITQTAGHVECDNESGVFLQGFDDSADLIHNHSETCLQIGDCMGDSVEYIEMASKSIISLNSSEELDGKENRNVNAVRGGTETPELFCDDAQCAVEFRDELRSVGSGNTAYFTPLVSKTNSILTEDLSQGSPPISQPEKSRTSKWYLVSEEETNYTCLEDSDASRYGAHLQQIFPITCAIPDLSTITEMSERNLNSCSPKHIGNFNT